MTNKKMKSIKAWAVLVGDDLFMKTPKGDSNFARIMQTKNEAKERYSDFKPIKVLITPLTKRRKR